MLPTENNTLNPKSFVIYSKSQYFDSLWLKFGRERPIRTIWALTDFCPSTVMNGWVGVMLTEAGGGVPQAQIPPRKAQGPAPGNYLKKYNENTAILLKNRFTSFYLYMHVSR